MMNKKYKSAFETVCPSESSVERIFDMTKNKKLTFKPFLIAAIITILASVSLISVNAATDGAIEKKAEEIVESIKIFIGGEEVQPEDVEYEQSSEIIDGKQVNSYSFDVSQDGTNGRLSFIVSEDSMEFDMDTEGFVSVVMQNSVNSFSAEVVNENGEIIEFQIPTTREATSE